MEKTIKTTSEKVNDLLTYLQANPLFKDQKIYSGYGIWHKDKFSIHISGDYFYDRICGNGRMPGFTSRIDFNDRGILVNITDGHDGIKDAICFAFSKETYDAYIEREKFYWSKENPHANDYHQRSLAYNKSIEDAKV